MTELVIYGLVDPRNGKLRYVGKSTRGLMGRFREHEDEARCEKTHKANWLRQLLATGAHPLVKLLECVGSPEELDRAERRWIALYRTFNGNQLTNATDGGDGGAVSAEAKQRRDESIRRGWIEGRIHPFKGKTHTATAREAMRKAALARLPTDSRRNAEHQSRASAARWAKPGARELAQTRVKQQWATRRGN